MNLGKKMARLAYQALDEKKAMDIKIIDIGQVSTIADYFLIASGSNQNQVQAMVDNVEEKLGKAGYEPKQIEGTRNSSWILMDYGDLIVHVFDEPSVLRSGENLERRTADQPGGTGRRVAERKSGHS